MKTKFFFDLELTLIFSWQDAMILYQHRPIFEKYGAIGVTADLFSFAVNDQHDAITFDQTYQTVLEKEFDLQFDNIWTVKELMDISKWEKSMTEYKWYHGKTKSFIDLITNKLSKTQTEPTTYVLFDDMVDDNEMYVDENTIIKFVWVG